MAKIFVPAAILIGMVGIGEGQKERSSFTANVRDGWELTVS